MSQTIVIKIGGNATDHLSTEFYQQLHQWHQKGDQILIVHGGGPQISNWSSKLNLPVKKIDGIRVTDLETIKVTQAVLLGLVQPALCQHLTANELPVMGLNATGHPVVFGDYLDQNVYGEVGKVTSINQKYITEVLQQQIGVCAPLVVTKAGKVLNVNGDAAAAGIARLIGADKLILLTDVPGVMVADHIVDSLTQHKAQKLLANNVIKAGMKPKILAAFEAIQNGVKKVEITNEIKHAGTHLMAKQIVC
ncbi:MAG: acetylglutamate kinase [Lentilactobacillus diolivorans]|jgi:acetylglutamate kinase|nr:acetylglutamate kinase [Lentilactobacillus diolivorans]RRG03323.1 MAG: acetylglutamate kinase [Lactobacillus sp.]